MGLMTSMRNRMHVVLWGLLAMFLLSMTIGGLVGGANIIDQLLGRVNPNTTIARINDQDITPDILLKIPHQVMPTLWEKTLIQSYQAQLFPPFSFYHLDTIFVTKCPTESHPQHDWYYR